ncbi:MAG: hypothetical protein V4733_11055 [Verrucomicrobiota bacterium]
MTLDDDVAQILKDVSHQSHKPFKNVLNDTLRQGLKQYDSAKEAPFVVRAKPMGLRAGIDPAGFQKLVDDLAAESFLETTKDLTERQR